MTSQEIRGMPIPGVDFLSEKSKASSVTREFQALKTLCIILRELTAQIAECNEQEKLGRSRA
jgi:hypothetical protein